MQIDRQQLVEELRLRKLIRKAIKIVENKRQSDELRLKNVLKELIKEDEVGDTRDAPYGNTGLNTLNTLFDNILTQLEDGYKSLATSKEQRDSFASHILVNVVNTLAPLRALDSDEKAVSEDIDINVASDDPQDMDDVRMSDEEKELQDFTIAGQDLTGRDAAKVAFNSIETQIVDAYKTLHNEEDIEKFYNGLLSNLDLYFKKFEDEMKPSLPKPDTGEDVETELEPPVPPVDLEEPEDEMDLEDIANI